MNYNISTAAQHIIRHFVFSTTIHFHVYVSFSSSLQSLLVRYTVILCMTFAVIK